MATIWKPPAMDIRGGLLRNAAVLILAAAAATSCGVFDTRDPNPPGGSGQETPRHTPVDMDAVIFNFVNAVAYKDQGNYEEALSKDFVFLPDSEDRAFFISTVGSDIFEGWDSDKEMKAVRLIFSDAADLAVDFPEESRRELADTAYVRINYTFTQTFPREGVEDSVATFKGLAEIHLKANSSGMWSIDRWKETRTEDALTWGRLKGNTIGS